MEESLLLNGIHLYHLGRTNIKPYVYGVEAAEVTESIIHPCLNVTEEKE